MIEKLQSFPTQRHLRIATLAGFVAFIILIIVMYPFTAATTAAGVPGVIDIELTWGKDRAQEIMTAWASGNLRDGQFILNIIDFAYMPAYAFFMGGAVLITARKLPDGGHQKRFGFAAALMPFIAAACDVVENANLLQMFIGNITDLTALTASIMATIKFAFLFIAIGAFAGHLIRLLIVRVKDRVPQVEKKVPVATK
jgi:hypothetical protein